MNFIQFIKEDFIASTIIIILVGLSIGKLLASFIPVLYALIFFVAALVGVFIYNYWKQFR